MANMNFKANILPASSQSYNLGSSTQQWVVYGPIHSNGLYGTPNIDYGDTLPSTAVEGQIFFQTTTTANYTVPSGGYQGQVLTKYTDADGDTYWESIPNPIPSGGTAGYALVKYSNSDGDYGWQPIQTQIDAMSVTEIKGGTVTYARTMRADYLKSALSTLGGSGLTFTHDYTQGLVLNHSNSVVAKGSYAAAATTANAAGGSITLTDVQYDAQGHITASQDRTITLGLTTGYGDTTNPYASKTANYVLAAPIDENGAPAFRKLGLEDLPELNIDSSTTGTLPISRGGTGATTAEDAWTNLGGGSVGKLNLGSSGTYYLANNGTWTIPPGTYVLPEATKATTDTAAILGGVTIGNGINVDQGEISVDWSNAPVSSVNNMTGAVVLEDLVIGSKRYNGTTATVVAVTDLGLASPMTFRGVTDSVITDGTDTTPVNIVTGGMTIGSYTPVDGDVVLQKTQQMEFVYSNNAWHQLGVASSYSLAEHSHGFILNDGVLQQTTTATTNDRLLIADASDSYRVMGSNLTFDASAPYSALSRSGEWVDYLQLTGGTMTGAIKTKGLVGTLNVDYGDILPTTATEGQIFFQVSYGEDDLSIPPGGATGSALVKNSNSTGDFSWKQVIPPGGTAGYALVKNSNATGDLSWAPAVPSGGTTGQVLIKNSNANGDTTWGTITANDRVLKAGDTMTGNLIISMASGGSVRALNTEKGYGIYLDSNSSAGNHGIWSTGYWNGSAFQSSGKWIIYRGQDGEAHSGMKLYGAVWNDYAEFRQSDVTQPGRVIKENGDDTLSFTTKRLERGCEIISDTFGFAIGETEKAKTPTAASGRVLAYPYEDREVFKDHIGWPVCSGPGGTVSIMTPEEEEKYPSRIIGTVSAVPDYKVWFGGDKCDRPIAVNGRVWIRVR